MFATYLIKINKINIFKESLKNYKIMENPKFETDKIVKYLEKYKSKLPELIIFKSNINKLVELNIITETDKSKFNNHNNFENEIHLKKIINEKLIESKKSNIELYNKLCLWIVKDWGGITAKNDEETINLSNKLLEVDNPEFNRIASTSKIGAFFDPENKIIYDSRVAFTLNWIILSENAGNNFFPIPDGRNSKMIAFDMNVLIRLNHIFNYKPNNINELKNKKYISNHDKIIWINSKYAYKELNKLIKEISVSLWVDDPEKQKNLYYTEMLLFSIADNEIVKDITNRVTIQINGHA